MNSFWLGIHDKKKEGTFVYASDNSKIGFNNWRDGEPNNHDNGGVCLKSAKWHKVGFFHGIN